MSNAILYNNVLATLEKLSNDAKKETGLSDEDIATLQRANPDNWATLIPKIDDTGLPSDEATASAGVFCVWDPLYNRCCASCTWTVPAGASRVNFQIWGSGGGSSSGCCCGGHPGGSTGEFKSIIMDVTPGEVYCLCTGCVNCCFGYHGGIQITGACACIQGPGITCLGTNYGCGTLCSWKCSIEQGLTLGYSPTSQKYVQFKDGQYRLCYPASPLTRFFAPQQTSGAAGGCFCNSGYDYCFDNSCASCGEMPYIISHCTPTPLAIDSARNVECGFIPKRWNVMCYDSNHYGYVIYAPTVCFGPTGPTTQKAVGSDCCFTFTSGNCCGYNCSTVNAGMASAMFACMPGHGAVFNHAMGGGVSLCGDHGRGAAIRVTYC